MPAVGSVRTQMVVSADSSAPTDVELVRQGLRLATRRAGNGAFVTSCPQHSGAQKLGFSKWAIGGVPLRLALRRWWEAPPDAPAEAHAHLPCALRDAPANGSHNCEPSCAKVCKAERPTFGFELPP